MAVTTAHRPTSRAGSIARRVTTVVVTGGLALAVCSVPTPATTTAAVASSSTTCSGLLNYLRSLQAELRTASSSEKPGIIREIRSVEQMLHAQHCPGW